MCLVLIKRSSRWDEEPECQKLFIFWKCMEVYGRRVLVDPPHLDHKTGPEGDFRCDGAICQSLLEIEAEQLINLLSH